MRTPLELARITDLRQDGDGAWCATVHLNGDSLDVERTPTWRTIKDEAGVCREILPGMAALLQQAVQNAEGDNRKWRRR